MIGSCITCKEGHTCSHLIGVEDLFHASLDKDVNAVLDKARESIAKIIEKKYSMDGEDFNINLDFDCRYWRDAER